MSVIKKFLFIFLFLFIGVSENFAADHKEKEKEYDENKRLVVFLKDQNPNFQNVVVREPRSSLHPYAWMGWTFVDRPLEDRDVQSTAIRGILIGFSNQFFDCLDVLFYNVAFHGGGQFGKQVVEDPRFTIRNITLSTIEIIVDYIFKLAETISPFDSHRNPKLDITSYDTTLYKRDVNGSVDNIVREIKSSFEPAIRKVLLDIRTNKIILADHIFNHIRSGDVIKEFFRRLDLKFGDLQKISEISELSNNDALDVNLYKKSSHINWTLGEVGKAVAEVSVYNKIEEMKFSEEIKPVAENFINYNFKNRYLKLEEKLDPVFMKIGEKYALELIALSIEPLAKLFSQDPLKFITERSKPTNGIINFVKALEWLGSHQDKKQEITFIGLDKI